MSQLDIIVIITPPDKLISFTLYWKYSLWRNCVGVEEPCWDFGSYPSYFIHTTVIWRQEVSLIDINHVTTSAKTHFGNILEAELVKDFFKDDLDWNVKWPMKAIQKILVVFPADSSVWCCILLNIYVLIC